MAKIIAKGQYQHGPRGILLRKGDVVDVTEETWAFLQKDAPGNFELYTEPVVDKPPADKAIKRSRTTRKTKGS
jgi:hypothetical protein